MGNKEDILEAFLLKFFTQHMCYCVMSICKINLHKEILMTMAHYPKIIPTTHLYLELCKKDGWETIRKRNYFHWQSWKHKIVKI